MAGASLMPRSAGRWPRSVPRPPLVRKSAAEAAGRFVSRPAAKTSSSSSAKAPAAPPLRSSATESSAAPARATAAPSA